MITRDYPSEPAPRLYQLRKYFLGIDDRAKLSLHLELLAELGHFRRAKVRRAAL